MTPQFRHVALIGKYHHAASGTVAPGSRDVLERIAAFLVSQGCRVSLESETAQSSGISGYPALNPQGIGAACDLGLVVGGDGTMLSIGRKLAPFGTPLIGINQGRLGFVTDIPLENFETTLTPMLHGAFEEDRRPLIQGQVLRDGECVFDALAMNDVVVNRGATSGMVELRVEVDGHFVANQRADGLIVASPTGSTAYALSAGGPILDPRVPAITLVPVAPHALTHRPIALSEGAVVSIRVIRGRHAALHCDGHAHFPLDEGESVVIRRAPHPARFLHPEGHDHFAMLREKLSWSETPERLKERRGA